MRVSYKFASGNIKMCFKVSISNQLRAGFNCYTYSFIRYINKRMDYAGWAIKLQSTYIFNHLIVSLH